MEELSRAAATWRYDSWTTEPVLHTHVSDVLPEEHALAYTSIYCIDCSGLVHAFNNECMQAWAETESGPMCLHCLIVELP